MLLSNQITGNHQYHHHNQYSMIIDNSANQLDDNNDLNLTSNSKLNDASDNEDSDAVNSNRKNYENLDDLSDSDENYVYLTIGLNSESVKKLKSLSKEQISKLNQLGILSIQIGSDKYVINLTEQKVKQNKHENLNDSSVSESIIPSSFVLTSGLTLDDCNQIVSLNLNANSMSQIKPFTMPCPLLKNILNNEALSQNPTIQNDQINNINDSHEFIKILKMRQALASQTQASVKSAPNEPAASLNGKNAASTGATKKPRRTPSDKPKAKRTKVKSEQSAVNSENKSNTSASETKQPTHQEKIRNILNDTSSISYSNNISLNNHPINKTTSTLMENNPTSLIENNNNSVVKSEAIQLNSNQLEYLHLNINPNLTTNGSILLNQNDYNHSGRLNLLNNINSQLQ